MLEDCTRAFPHHARLHFLLGLARRDGSPPELDAAAEAFRRASALAANGDPARAGYLVALADVECEAQNLGAAEQAIQEALDLDPTHGQAEAVQAKIASGNARPLRQATTPSPRPSLADTPGPR